MFDDIRSVLHSRTTELLNHMTEVTSQVETLTVYLQAYGETLTLDDKFVR